MDDNKPNGTRITVERISVTTIRTQNRSQKVYCDSCKAEIESGEIDQQPRFTKGQVGSRTIDLFPTVKLESE